MNYLFKNKITNEQDIQIIQNLYWNFRLEVALKEEEDKQNAEDFAKHFIVFQPLSWEASKEENNATFENLDFVNVKEKTIQLWL